MSIDTPESGPGGRLLAEIAPLTGPERMHRLALYARTHRDEPLLAVTAAGLDALGQPAFGAHLALAARDTALLSGYLTGPDQDLSRRLLSRCHGLPLPNQVFVEILDNASYRLRRTLYTALYLGRRTEAADRLLPVVRERHGAGEAVLLLPACSGAVVDEQLDELAHRVEGWNRFARRHPRLLVARLERELDTAQNPDLIWAGPWNHAAWALSDEAPELLLPFLRGRREPHSSFPAYAGARRLLHTRGDDIHYANRYPALTHGSRHIRDLLKAMHDAKPRALAVLRAMRYADRTPILERFIAEGGGERAALLPYLGLLPAERARAEARRILAYLESLRTAQPDHAEHRDTEALSHLPFGEAEAALTKAARAPDPERREHALYWLVVAAGREGTDTLARVLGSVLARSAADRHHVRGSVPLALGTLSPHLIGPDTLPQLYRLLEDNLAAPDLDSGVAAALRHLAVHLLHHLAGSEREDLAGWALTSLTRLTERLGERGFDYRHGTVYAHWHRRPTPGHTRTLAAALTRDRARELYTRLAPVLDRARARGAHQSTVALARALDRHLYALPDLLDRALSEVILADPATSTAQEAAALHMRGIRPGERAQNLFRAAPATALIPPVWERLARLRPALVPETLAAVAPLGRAGGRLPQRFVSVRTGLAGSWLETERGAAAEYLWDTAADRANDTSMRAEALRGLGALPGGADLLLPWLEEDDGWLRETVLVRLARTDQPERVLTVLLEHASEGTSSRAVVAVLGSCARRVAPTVLLELLGGVLTAPGKVSVRKTAARVLGQVRPPGGIELLVGLLDQEDLHRDVRAAVLQALIANNDHPVVLPALEERRSTFGDPVARSALLAQSPLEVHPDQRLRAARFMLSLPAVGDPVVDEHPLVCGQVAGWALWDTELAEKVIADLRDLTLSDLRVLRTFAGLLHEQRYRDRLADVVADLADLCPAPADRGVPLRKPEVDREPSLPGRVAELVRMLGHRLQARTDMERPVPGLDRAVDRLTAHPGLRAEAVDLRLADLPVLTWDRHRSVPVDVFGARVSAWAELAARHPGSRSATPQAAASAVLSGTASREGNLLHVAELLRHLTDLALRDTTPAGRLLGLVAVELAGRQGATQGWTGPWAGIVADLGQSPHEEVRVAAWRTAAL
jgi:HEAT repeat protein